MPNTGYAAYARTQSTGLRGRELEGRAFAKAAHLLETAADNPGDAGALAEALKFNTHLWTIVQAEVSDPAGTLPRKLRADLASLSLFMDKRTAAMLRRPDPAVLHAMADVDRSIASGLLD